MTNRRSLKDWISGIEKKDRSILAQALTLVESTRLDHQKTAIQLVSYFYSKAHQSIRIGISGSPGVGKSTLITALTQHLLTLNQTVGVLAIDPTSPFSHGSILGDKTRMNAIASDPRVYIRPSPSADQLGGVGRASLEKTILLEAAGFDTVLIETVGVGQSETLVRNTADLVLVLIEPGAGDELQGMKKGLMEIADLLAVTKCDGDRIALAKETCAAYQSSLQISPVRGQIPEMVTCSANDMPSIARLWDTLIRIAEQKRSVGAWEAQRTKNAGFWAKKLTLDLLFQQLLDNTELQEKLQKLTSSTAADGGPFSQILPILKHH